MSWLAALGQGGLQGVDRWQQLKQQDRQRAVEDREWERQGRLDTMSRQLNELRMQQLQNAIRGQNRSAFLDLYGPGSQLDETGEQEARNLGFGGLVLGGPDGSQFRGTVSQQQAAEDRRRAGQTHDAQLRLLGLEGNQIEDTIAGNQQNRQRMTDYMASVQDMNDPIKIAMAATRFGMPEMASGVSPIITSNAQRAIAGMNMSADRSRFDREMASREQQQVMDAIERMMGNYINGMSRVQTDPTTGDIIPNPLAGIDIDALIRRAIAMGANGRRGGGGVMPPTLFGGGGEMYNR